ncbi:hypothetical protein H1C71_033094 [Ictidomys tridecemlineatus]|nr:hypothetical protein H1C71_033094 [Ictidomys tridecemlineatus]
METGLKSRSRSLTGEFLSRCPTRRHSANADWTSGPADPAEFLGSEPRRLRQPREGGRAARTNRLKMAEDVLSFYPAAQRTWIGSENEGTTYENPTQSTAKCGSGAWRVC